MYKLTPEVSLNLKKYMPPFFTHTTLGQTWEEGVCSISLVYNFMSPPHPVPRDVTHYIGRQS